MYSRSSAKTFANKEHLLYYFILQLKDSSDSIGNGLFIQTLQTTTNTHLRDLIESIRSLSCSIQIKSTHFER